MSRYWNDTLQFTMTWSDLGHPQQRQDTDIGAHQRHETGADHGDTDTDADHVATNHCYQARIANYLFHACFLI